MKKSSPFTLRTFITGAFLCFLVSVACQYSDNVVLGSTLAVDHLRGYQEGQKRLFR